LKRVTSQFETKPSQKDIAVGYANIEVDGRANIAVDVHEL
jgi:hypothetical protein